MKWRTIVELYCGTIGKCLLVISLATPFAFIMDIGINVNRYYYSLSGALVLALAYILSVLKSPAIIKSYASANEYSEKLLNIYKRKGLDYILEFKCLEANVDKLSNGYDKELHYISEFKTITDFVKEFGDEKAVRNMSVIKYEFINNKDSIVRYFLTSIFCIGFILLYLPLLKSVLKIIFGGCK